MATKKVTSMVKWDEKFATMAKKSSKIVSSIGGDSNFIKLQSGVLQYQGAAIPGNTMDVVVIDHVLLNMLYVGKFDASNPTSPVCFAFGEVASEMTPHEDSHDPQNNNEGCATCEHNEFGSADTGRGKACKNSVRLALISINDLEDVAGAEVAYMHVPVTSVKLWAGHVRNVDDVHHRPPLGVVTRMTVVPDKDTQFKVQFELVSLIEDNEQITALFAKYEEVNKAIQFPFVYIEAAAKPVASSKNRKFAAPAAGQKGKK
jgi:hypothetical protein